MITNTFLIHHSHTDLGYTDDADKVFEQHLGYLDQALDLVRATRRRSSARKFYWTVESSAVARAWCARAGRAGERRLAAAIEAGQIELGAFSCQSVTHLQSLAELRHDFEWACRFSREAGRKCTAALLNDVPGANWKIADLLAEQGVELFLLGSGAYRLLVPWSGLPPLFWWEGPEGGRVLFYTYHLAEEAPGTGSAMPPGCYGWGKVGFLWPSRKIRRRAGGRIYPMPVDEFLDGVSLPDYEGAALLGRLEKAGYPAQTLLLQAASDNAGPDPNLPLDLAELRTSPRLGKCRLGLTADFLATLSAEKGLDLPVLRGDLQCSFSDQLAAGAQALAQSRSAARLVSYARRLGTAVTPDAQPLEDSILDHAELFTEHTCGASSWCVRESSGGAFGPRLSLSLVPETSCRRKAAFASAALARAGALAAAREAQSLKDAGPADLLLANTLKQSTGSLVLSETMPLPSRPLELRAPGLSLPMQAEEIKPKWWRLWFRAPRLRPGQRLPLQVRRAGSKAATGEVAGQGELDREGQSQLGSEGAAGTREAGLRLEARSGLCRHWADATGRALLAEDSPHGLGEILHSEVDGVPVDARGAGMHWPLKRKFSRPVRVETAAGVSGEMLSSATACRRLRSPSGLYLETATEWVEFHADNELLISCSIDKPRNVSREDLRIAFPFAGSCRDLFWEEAGTIVGWRDLLPGSHTGWLTVGQWIAVAGEQGTYAIYSPDAPLFEAGGITAETWRGAGPLPGQARLYCYLANNLVQTNAAQWQALAGSWRFWVKWFPGRCDRKKVRTWADTRDLGLAVVRPAGANA